MCGRAIGWEEGREFGEWPGRHAERGATTAHSEPSRVARDRTGGRAARGRVEPRPTPIPTYGLRLPTATPYARRVPYLPTVRPTNALTRNLHSPYL